MRWLISILLLTVVLGGSLHAQEYPFAPVDGPSIKKDSLVGRHEILPQMPPSFLPLAHPSFLYAPDGPETGVQFDARINAATSKSVIESVNQSLYWQRLPDLNAQQKAALLVVGFVSSLFLTNQFGFRPGYVPMMNPSFPFIDAKVPGSAPYVNMYSDEAFPKTVKTVYDPATGTYKQVMLEWGEYQNNLSRSLGKSLYVAPVPSIPVTPVDRAIRNL